MPKTKEKRVRRELVRGANGSIELLLIQSVEHLGKPGDIVQVKPGYAKNFLLPQGLATFATEHHKRMVEKHKAKLLEIQKVRLASLQARAHMLSNESVTIEANATDEGQLYGSVGAPDIVAALKGKGINDVTTDMVRLQGPLKVLGLYTVRIHMGHDIEADLKVWVVPSAESGDR
ncbi:MAG TPA: 50S ribosomal protein L9 [Pirellulales bacterium]